MRRVTRVFDESSDEEWENRPLRSSRFFKKVKPSPPPIEDAADLDDEEDEATSARRPRGRRLAVEKSSDSEDLMAESDEEVGMFWKRRNRRYFAEEECSDAPSQSGGSLSPDADSRSRVLEGDLETAEPGKLATAGFSFSSLGLGSKPVSGRSKPVSGPAAANPLQPIPEASKEDLGAVLPLPKDPVEKARAHEVTPTGGVAAAIAEVEALLAAAMSMNPEHPTVQPSPVPADHPSPPRRKDRSQPSGTGVGDGYLNADESGGEPSDPFSDWESSEYMPSLLELVGGYDQPLEAMSYRMKDLIHCLMKICAESSRRALQEDLSKARAELDEAVSARDEAIAAQQRALAAKEETDADRTALRTELGELKGLLAKAEARKAELLIEERAWRNEAGREKSRAERHQRLLENRGKDIALRDKEIAQLKVDRDGFKMVSNKATEALRKLVGSGAQLSKGSGSSGP